jgi:anthranilate phosphoribosyltransferase
MLQELTRELEASRDLPQESAAQALELILAEGTPDREIMAFLSALYSKGETPSEIAGFARIMRRHAVSLRCRHRRFIDTAGTGGGADTFNVSTAAAFVIAGAGLPVAKHGNRAATSRSGSADVLQALGVQVGRSAEVARRSLDELGIAFLFAPLFHPAMKRVVQIRRQLPHRTIFNLLGPLTNPAGAPYQIIGVYSRELTRKLGQALAALGCRRAWVVHSRDGLDELSTAAPSWVTEVEEDRERSFEFDPAPHAFAAWDPEAVSGGSPEDNGRLVRAILEGRQHGSPRDLVVLNAAAALHLAGEPDFRVALDRAAESIDSGSAVRKLDQLIEAYAG